MPRELTREEIQALPQEVRAQLAEQMRANIPSTQEAVEAGRLEAIQQENPTLSTIFPGMARQAATGEEQGFGKSFLTAATQDLPSMVGRTASAIGEAGAGALQGKDLEEIGRQYMETLQSPEGRNIFESIIKDPSTPFALAMAPMLAPLAKTGLLGALGAGAIEGSAIGTQRQLGNIGRGQDVSGGELAVDIGLSAALPIVGAGAKKGLKPLWDRTVGKASSFIADQISGVSSEILEQASTKPGRQQLLKYYGKTYELGKDLLNKVKNIENNLELEQGVQDVLSKAPDVSIDNTLQTLNAYKKSLGNSFDELKAKKYIDDIIIPDVKSEVPESALSGLYGGKKPSSVNAKDFREMRKKLDTHVDFENTKYADYVNQAYKKARTAAAESLEKSAEKADPAYKSLMKKYKEIYDSREELYNYIGKKSSIQKGRTQQFISTIFGKNKDARQEVLKKLDDIMGEDFTKKAKLSVMADVLFKNGKIPIFPTQFTGRSVLGVGSGVAGLQSDDPNIQFAGAIGLGLSSPRIAMEAIGAPTTLSNIATNPILMRTLPMLSRQPLQQGLGQ